MYDTHSVSDLYMSREIPTFSLHFHTFSFMLTKFTISMSNIILLFFLLFYIDCIPKPSINTYFLLLSAHISPTYFYIRENCLNIIFLSVCLSHCWGGTSSPYPDINPVCLCVSRRS